MANKIFKQILNEIKKWDTIIILRHESPDFDASGSQFGLKEWIKYIYPNKKVYAFGQTHYTFSPKLYPATDVDTDIELEPNSYLCIVVDVANRARLDHKQYLDTAGRIIKIDHHPNVEPYGDICYVDDSASAAAEILTELIMSSKKGLNKEAAFYLYSALVGDSGRFQYSSTTPKTFEIASYLVNTGIEITDIYERMYVKKIKEIETIKTLYSKFKITEHGVGYYHISDKDLHKLDMKVDEVKAFVNLLAGYEEIHIWVQCTEDVENEEFPWRVSIRSRKAKVNDIASNYNGGGHDNASGCKCRSIEETMSLINDLDKSLA